MSRSAGTCVRWLGVLAVVLVAACASPEPDVARRVEANELLEVALQRYRAEGNAVELERELRRALEISPDFPDPRYNLAVLSLEREDWGGAISWFEEYLSYGEDSPMAPLARAQLASARAARELESSPEGRRGRLYVESTDRATGLLGAGLFLEAFDTAAEAAELAPDRPEAYLVAASALWALGAYERAQHYLSDAAVRVPADSRATLASLEAEMALESQYLSKVAEAERYTAAGRHAAAGAAFEEAWRLPGERGDAGIQAALAWGRAGQAERSKEILREVGLTSTEAGVTARRMLRVGHVARARGDG